MFEFAKELEDSVYDDIYMSFERFVPGLAL